MEETSLFMDVLGGANQVELNLFRTQMDEERQVRALASGLRVNSAVDDPSGYSIAETIQTKVSGLQMGVQNVQNASNLLNVADATLATVQMILERIHSLIVEAASDLNSTQQLQSLQTEIDQLLEEINKISGGTKFNGLSLLNGSLSTQQATSPYVEFVQPDLNPNGSVPSTQVYDETGGGSNNPGPLIFQDGATPMFGNQPNFVAGYNEIQIISYSNDPYTPYTGYLGQPGVVVKFTQYSSDPNFGGTNGATEQVSYAAFATGTGIDQGLGPGNPIYLTNASGSANMLVFGLANLSPQDVGTAAAVETFYGQSAGTGQPITVNTGGNEGNDVTISLPNVSTSALQVSGISVLQPQYVDTFNNPTGTGSNAQAVDDAEARVENALNVISGARAQVGSQVVAMQENANDASTQIVNQIASESAIRDANIAQATASFTKDQILSQIGLSVLAQMQASSQLVYLLVGNVNPTGAGLI